VISFIIGYLIIPYCALSCQRYERLACLLIICHCEEHIRFAQYKLRDVPVRRSALRHAGVAISIGALKPS
jgi:hypothetical protein